ncbi:MAG: AGE family epimerase/isomerase [Bacteroidota bacterium]|nr:AGE family epimerase/isomerase [Bacteroidota bacterium]
MIGDLQEISRLYKSELLERVIPFWELNSTDREYGGYFTCLDRKGRIYDTDKFIWLQARQIWMFSKLYGELEQKNNWLEIANTGADFLKKYGRDQEGNWYFALTREGKPLVQAYNIFSDCFAAMAFARRHKINGDDEDARIASDTFMNILSRYDNPKGRYNKNYPGIRTLKSLSLPMIMCNISMELEGIITSEKSEETIENCIHEIMELFYNEKSGLLMENVNEDGSRSDCFEGRLLNPGHAMEAMWFIMDLARRKKDMTLIHRAVDILMRTVDYGWDTEHGGIFYFLDIKGYPTQQLEWDQKLWWVHIEALVALIKAYFLTGREDCLRWFNKVHDYTWSSFPDPQYDEWFGYLNRRGEVLLNLKGGKWKGCFHLPRGLYIIFETLEKIITER